MQSFTVCKPLLAATSAFILGRRRWSSRRQCYLHCLGTTSYDNKTNRHTFNCPFSGTAQVSRYQKVKTYVDFTEARDSEWQWQWHQLGHMQVCTSLQADNHARTPPLSILLAGCPSCCPTNSIKALKANHMISILHYISLLMFAVHSQSVALELIALHCVVSGHV